MAANYRIENYAFNLEAYFPQYIADRITDIRVDAPEIIEQHAKARRCRARLTLDGKLTILAADHPARGVTRNGAAPFGLANRHQYLGRIARVLIASDFDGFMGTPDMVEDLFILDYLVQQGGGASFLDGKVLIGCMQRGGVANVVGEIDDRFGAYTAASIHRFRLDGGKMMFRFAPQDERTLRTIDYCAKAISDLNQYEATSFVEALSADFVDGQWITRNTADALIPLVGIIGGLGDSSRHIWMKLPYCADFQRVAAATTMPILMLGGPTGDDPQQTCSDFAAGMTVARNVRGAMVGRNVTFPHRDDPASVASAIHSIIHYGISTEDAAEIMMNRRDQALDYLTDHIAG